MRILDCTGKIWIPECIALTHIHDVLLGRRCSPSAAAALMRHVHECLDLSGWVRDYIFEEESWIQNEIWSAASATGDPHHGQKGD